MPQVNKPIDIIVTNNPEQQSSNYTRGEKCVFYHLFSTFTLVLLVIIIYFIHVCVIGHIGSEYYKITRISSVAPQKSSYYSIGMVYLNTSTPKIICCSILLKQQWSIVSAHCVTIRSNPELSNLLPKWNVKYKSINDEDMESGIKRGIVHSYYNSDDFSNNIGLFEHKVLIYTTTVQLLNFTMKSILKTENRGLTQDMTGSSKLKTVHWRDEGKVPGKLVYFEFRSITLVKPLSQEKCSRILSPIGIELRDNEFCVMKTSKKGVELDNGAVLLVDERIVGFFSWGDRTCKGVPFVILNIFPYKDWFDFNVSQ